MAAAESVAALECRDVTVRYGDVAALTDVSVAFPRGLIHAVVGQNGAGKTTFARVAAGLVQPTRGTVTVNGREVRTGHVAEARKAGVELVHQSFALPPSFTVAEAMEFGAVGQGALFTRAGLRRRWSEHLKALGLSVDPGARIRDLPVEQQQGVEIARALVLKAEVLILDEPTAVLAPAGIELLFDRLRALKVIGCTVIVILHKIRELMAIADTVTVLRGGRLVAAVQPRKDIDATRLATMIMGEAQPQSDLRLRPATGQGAASVGAPLLALEDFSTEPDSDGAALHEIALTVRAGEIVGVAGVEGNGQRTLVRAIADLAACRSGGLSLAGKAMTSAPLAARRRNGLRIIPFERNTEGLSLTNALWENWSPRDLLSRRLLAFALPTALRRDCDAALKRWAVRYHSSAQPAGSLSGGNAQKLILSREIDENARLIVAAQPTRGLDIAASAAVWAALAAARDRGCGILLISSDLDELFENSDRVVVMLSGRVVGEFAAPYDLGAVGRAMTGAAA